MKGLRALRSAAAAERFRFTARQHAVFMGLRRTQNTAAAAAAAVPPTCSFVQSVAAP